VDRSESEERRSAAAAAMSPPGTDPPPARPQAAGGGRGGGNGSASAGRAGLESSSLLGGGSGPLGGLFDPERGRHHYPSPSDRLGGGGGGGKGGGGGLLAGGPSRTASASVAAAAASRETCLGLLNSWASRKFATGAAILLPIVVTFYVTFAFLRFFDSLFSPLWRRFLGVSVVGLGLATSVLFVLGTGIFFSSWLGGWALGVGEWIVMRLPLVKAIYSASKQISAALAPAPDGGGGVQGAGGGPSGASSTRAFQECVIVRHPRDGSYAVGFVTARTSLLRGGGAAPSRLVAVYVPTNHVWVGDVVLIREEDVLPTQLTVRDGLEIVLSAGMNLPTELVAAAAVPLDGGLAGLGGGGGGAGTSSLGGVVGAPPGSGAMLRD